MSSVEIIVVIIVLLAVLVCYAFVAQTLKQKREQRARLLAALKTRARNFKFMINGFPQAFLPRDLTLLVQRSLIEVCENLSRLEPREPSHLQDLQAISSLMAETQRHAKPNSQVPLENPQQIKEVKICLEELYRFIHSIESKGTLSRNQAENYRSQIHQLALQITVDNYVIQGSAAENTTKPKLAIHYYDLAARLLLREGKPGQYDDRINDLKNRLKELNHALLEKNDGEPLTEQELAEQEEIDNAWNKFGNETDVWRKKHAYD